MFKRWPRRGKAQQHPSGSVCELPCTSAAASEAPPGLWLLLLSSRGGALFEQGKKYLQVAGSQ